MTINYKEEFDKFTVTSPEEKKGFILAFDIDFNTDIEPLFMLLDFLQAVEITGSVAYFETILYEFDIIKYLNKFYPETLDDGTKDTKNTIFIARAFKPQFGLITGVPNTFPAWHKRYSKIYDENEIQNWEYRKSS